MNYCIKREIFCGTSESTSACSIISGRDKPKIPRPPNAFMLYANENRKRMSQLHPTESNKDISKRLGSGWKSLGDEERKGYFDRAKAIGLQHKKEYPDYVYNPKEARIRKAMRDATRERSIGTSPMLPRPNARRAPPPPQHSWVSPHDDLIMSPLAGMRTAMDVPVCGFSMSSGGNGGATGVQYMGGMGAYKMDPSPPMLPPTGSIHQNNYMQSTNPLAQLQQHTEMWPDYHQQSLRPRSSTGNPYIMSDYQPPPSEMSPPIMMETAVVSPDLKEAAVPSPHHVGNEDLPPDGAGEDVKPPRGHCAADVATFEERQQQQANEEVGEGERMMAEKNVMEEPPHQDRGGGGGHFLSPPGVFEEVDNNGRFHHQQPDAKKSSHRRNSLMGNKKPTNKALPDFNEAFGSTERGRFQSPPDPRLAPNKGYLDYFFESSPIRFEDYQI